MTGRWPLSPHGRPPKRARFSSALCRGSRTRRSGFVNPVKGDLRALVMSEVWPGGCLPGARSPQESEGVARASLEEACAPTSSHTAARTPAPLPPSTLWYPKAHVCYLSPERQGQVTRHSVHSGREQLREAACVSDWEEGQGDLCQTGQR